MTFNNLSLIEPILKALINEGYIVPTPIQEQAIPVLLEGKDVLGCAQTGTGKTAAFAIPIIQKLTENAAPQMFGKKHNKRQPIRALVLTPTRELAVQVSESFAKYGRYTGLKHTVVYGGVSQRSQTDALRNGIDIVIATPGRLLDLINQGYINLSLIEHFVLDEADLMLDMGFITDIQKIIALLPQNKQTLLFSATMPNEILSLAQSLLHDPVKIEVTPSSTTVEAIDQFLYFADKGRKTDLLIDILENQDTDSVLVFSRTKHGADKLSKNLSNAGIVCDAIHGNKSQSARQKSLLNFKRKRTRVLVATDIAARGIDISQISHVVNYDLPETPETYVHRIGRTGRAGYSGTAFSFCDSGEIGLLKSIQKLIGKDIDVVKGHDFECAVCIEKVERMQRSKPKGSDAKSEKTQESSPRGARSRSTSGRNQVREYSPNRENSRESASGRTQDQPREYSRNRTQDQPREYSRSRNSDQPRGYSSSRGQDKPREYSNRGQAGSYAPRPERSAESRNSDQPRGYSSSRGQDKPREYSNRGQAGSYAPRSERSAESRNSDQPRGYSSSRGQDKPREYSSKWEKVSGSTSEYTGNGGNGDKRKSGDFWNKGRRKSA
jgi:ATP-dependent RNA helicase RhlE